MRIELAADLITRDGTASKDAKLLNAFVDDGMVFKRPAANTELATTTGQAQGAIFAVNSLVYAVNGDVMKSYNSSFVLQQTITL
jgi:hypothetical protein